MKDRNKGLNKVCPTCKKEYSTDNDYCRDDGTRLRAVDFNKPSSEARLGRDMDSGAWRVSGRAEKG
jgi:hypothetical protein